MPKGGSIARGYGARLHFHVLVEGVATIRSMYRGIPEDPRPQYSGCCFDMGERGVRCCYCADGRVGDLVLLEPA